MSYPTGRGEGSAKCGPKLYDSIGVGVEIMPGVGKWFREPNVFKHASGEGGVERIEELVIIIRGHGGVEVVEERVFKVALGVPRDLNWFPVGDASSKVGVGNRVEPRFEGLVVGPSFHPVERAVH